MTRKNRDVYRSTPPKTKKKKGFRRPRFLTGLLLFALVMALIINGVLAASLLGTKVTNNDSIRIVSGKTTAQQEEAIEREAELNEQEEQLKRSGTVSFTTPPAQKGDNLDAVVRNRNDLLGALDLTYPGRGFSFGDDYQVSEEQPHDNGTLYKLQQKYNGCVIDGYTMNVSVDASGIIQYADGYHTDLHGLSTDTAIGGSDASELAEKYLLSTYRYDLDAISLRCADKSIRCIEDTPVVGYAVSVSARRSGIPIRDLYIDANESKVIYDRSCITGYERVTANLPGQKLDNQTFYIDKKSDEEYFMADSETRMGVYDANGSSFSDWIKAYDNQTNLVITWDGKNRNAIKPTAVDALANLERVYTFYKDVFGREGLTDDTSADPIPVVVDISSTSKGDFTGNAAMINYHAMIIGTKESGASWSLSQYLDVMGHEFSHGILTVDANLYNNASVSRFPSSHEFDAINEGLADIFGEFVEDYSDDKQLNRTCNWVSGEERSAKSPSGSEITDAKNYDSSKSIDPITGAEEYNMSEYDGVYVIKHPVYLMSEGFGGDREISSRQLAYLFYDLMRELSPNDTFKDFRRKLEHLVYFPGRFGGDYILDEKQKESVLDAFDQVGIETDYTYHLTPDAELTIYDLNKEPYEDALITLVTLDGKTAVQSQETNGSTYRLPNVAPGLYTLIVEDKESDGRLEFSAIINDNAGGQLVSSYREKDDVFTNFGGDSGHIALILDTSGSMDGTPIRQARLAAENFVSTMHKEAPKVCISLIQFAGNAYALDERSTDQDKLISDIRNLGSGGDTNMYASLEMAQGLLAEDDHPAIVIMGDGMPSTGENYSGDYVTPVSDKAEELRDEGVTIYSFGFFHSLSGSELSEGQSMMRAIGSPGYTYNVTDAASDDINAVFQNIAYQITHKGNTTHVEVACPVDVTVRYNGEELSSREGGNRQTSFGLLTFEGEDDEIKILNLKSGPDYEIIIEGYDTGTMDYSISYSDEEGNYVDTRTFEEIPIQDGTFITTSAGESGRTELKVDEDGNGSVDYAYRAGKDSRGRRTIFANNKGLVVFLIIMTVIFLVLYGILALIDLWKRKKHRATAGGVPAGGSYAGEGRVPGRRQKAQDAAAPVTPRFCGMCGNPLVAGEKFCRKCGCPVSTMMAPAAGPASGRKAPASYAGPDRRTPASYAGPGRNTPASYAGPGRDALIDTRSKSSLGVRITKIVLTSLLAVEMIIVLVINGLPATSVYQRLADHEYTAASHIYENKVKDTGFGKSYLSFLTDRYVRKAESARDAGRINEQTLSDLLTAVAEMDMGKASETAREIMDK